MKLLITMTLALMSITAFSQEVDNFSGVQVGKTKLSFIKDFKVELYKSAKYFTSNENGKKCMFTYPAKTVHTYVAGSDYSVTMVLTNQVPTYGLFFKWGAGNEALACESGLNLTQIQNLLMQNGLELKDAE